jgi:hypothetical protein
MASLIQFPFIRQSRALIDNPLYIQDITAANQQILDAITACAGLGTTDFAIVGGLVYTSGTPNFYTPGFFYLNGTWYYIASNFNEGQYLTPNITGIMPYTFNDAVVADIYDVNYATTSGSPTGNTPLFSGNMNQYRIDNKTLLATLVSQQAEITALQSATALHNVQIPSMGTSYVATFTQDQAVFFASAPSNCTITFNFAGAVPGVIQRLKFTFGSGITLTITAGAGQTILKESGQLSNAQNNTNLLTMIYAGINELGLPEVSYVLSQTA